MKVIYFGKICEDEVFSEIKMRKEPYFIAQYSYEKALYNEMKNDDTISISVNSIYQTEYYPKDNLFVNKNSTKTKFNYLKFINIPFLRELSYFFATCISIYKWWIKNRNSSKIIYSSNHFPPVSLAIVIMGKILKIRKVVTFTDLSLFTYSEERIRKMKWYKKIVIKPYLKIIDYLQTSYDGYILFSGHMNDIVNQNKKPYCVVEGIFNDNGLDKNLSIVNSEKKILAHAGTLNKEVGIDKIIEVFELIDMPDSELWLIGSGDMNQIIEEKSKSNDKIKFFGFLPKSEVFNLLKKASLLVNFRNPQDTYTKYSFPSKMFEYMVTETPVLTTRIQGIPNEYYDYLYSIRSYDSCKIAEYIKEIFNEPLSEREKLGREAKLFIENNKSPKKQVEKIVRFLSEV